MAVGTSHDSFTLTAEDDATYSRMEQEIANLGKEIARLTELFAGNGMIGYVTKERVDGKLILPEAVQILKLNASSKG